MYYQSLIKNLKKFYKNQELGIDTDDAIMFDIASDLAEIIIEFESNWTPGYPFSGDAEEDAGLLKEHYNDPFFVDQAVSGLHQGLMDATGIGGDDCGDYFYCENKYGWDIRQYILNRVH